MITDIARILRANNPNASAEWIQKLPDAARGLEDLFFRSAASFEEYRDRGTLKQRMQAAATALKTPPRPALRRALSIRFHKVTEGEITIWPIDPTAKLQQVFDTYTLKYRGERGVRGQELVFYLDGAVLHGNQTPEDVDMEDGDQIDVFEDASPAPKRSRQV